MLTTESWLKNEIPPVVLKWGSDPECYNQAFKSDATTSWDIRANIKELPTPECVLIRPDILRRYQLAYNPVNGIIVCENPVCSQSGVCGNALSIDNVWKHLTLLQYAKGSALSAHGWIIPVAQKPQLEAMLTECCPGAPVTAEQLKAVRPHADQRGPIAGIHRPVLGWACNECPTASPSYAVMSKHMQRHPGHSAKGSLTNCPLQTLSMNQHFKCWFRSSWAVGTELAASSQEAGDPLDELNQQLFGDEEEPLSSAIDTEAIMEFFRNSGAVDHITDFNAADLRSLVSLPVPDEPGLAKLRYAQTLRFRSSCKSIERGNAAIRRLIVTTLPYVITVIFFYHCH